MSNTEIYFYINPAATQINPQCQRLILEMAKFFTTVFIVYDGPYRLEYSIPNVYRCPRKVQARSLVRCANYKICEIRRPSTLVTGYSMAVLDSTSPNNIKLINRAGPL